MILIIKPVWVDKIFCNKKIWEIRGCDTKKRGVIRIAASGTGMVVGEVILSHTIPLTRELWDNNIAKHQVQLSWDQLLHRYKKPYAWVFKKPKLYLKPVIYYHPKGAVIWVRENQKD